MSAPQAHAFLSSSQAHIWMNCTPAPRFVEGLGIPESTSEYAEEGRFAHHLAELMLALELNRISEEDYLKEHHICTQNKYYSKGMEDGLSDYIAFVMESLATLSPAHARLEQKVDFSNYVPEGFGTSDVIITSEKCLAVIDLKYGKGVPVSAVNNPQMRLYALGALNEFGWVYNFETVTMVIYQPRLDSVSTETITISDLLNWVDTELKPKAVLAWDGNGEFVPGEHCRFCKGNVKCRALAQRNLELAKHEFRDPNVLSDLEIPDVLERIDALVNWAGKVKEYAYTEALKGKKWPGWKLVAGRSSRRYTDQNQVAKALKEAGLTDDQIYDMSVKGITKMEELLGKKRFEELLDSYLIKPPGTPTLVPNSDKRLEMNSLQKAIEEFSENPYSTPKSKVKEMLKCQMLYSQQEL